MTAMTPATVSPAPSLRVANAFGNDFKALGALEVSQPSPDQVKLLFDVSGRAHLFRGIVSDTIDGVKLVSEAKLTARCMPEPIDAGRAAKLIGSAGLTGVSGARVDSDSHGNPTMVVDVMVGSEQHVEKLLRDTIGGAPVRIAVQGD